MTKRRGCGLLLPVYAALMMPGPGIAHSGRRHTSPAQKTGEKPIQKTAKNTSRDERLTPGQQALARATAARQALEEKQAAEAQTLYARQAAALAAQDLARRQGIRAQLLATRKQHVQNALDDTSRRIAALTDDITTLQEEQDALLRDINRQSAALQPLLPIAERLSMTPNAALLVSPVTASESVEALSILGGLARLTRQRAETLQQQKLRLQTTFEGLKTRHQDLDALKKIQSHERDIAATRKDLAAQKKALADQQALKAQQAVVQAMQAATDLAAEITMLSQQEAQARAQLEAEAQALAHAHRLKEAGRVASRARALSSPGTGVSHQNGRAIVAGHVSVGWHENTEAGPATGITYATLASASVVAPCSGRIEFSGPFRSFGKMLILDCGQDYRFVISGLGLLAVSSGESIRRGAALGTMPEENTSLFVQLRHGAQTIDPAPFL